MRLEIILLISDPPTGYSHQIANMRIDMSAEATDLFRDLGPGVEYVISDIEGWGTESVIEAWKELMKSPFVTVGVDEKVATSEQWQTASLYFNDIGIKVHQMLKGKTD